MNNTEKQDGIMVTVCCICYNQKNTVGRTLDSILSQKTTFPFEIVVHDDASTDGTREIIEKYARENPDKIIPVLQTENQYSKGGRPDLYLIPLVNGKYVAFCEGDDYWCDDEKLQLQVDALEAYPSCSIAVHNVRKKSAANGKDLGKFPPVPVREGYLKAEEYIKQELGNGHWMFQISSLLIRSDVLKQYYKEFDSGYMKKFMVGDFPMITYALSKGDAYYIDRDMSVYSVESGGFMSSIKRNRKMAIRVNQSYIEGIEGFDRYTHNRFHTYTEKAILRRRFELLILKRDFTTLLSDPDYADLLKERGVLKRWKYQLLAIIPIIPIIIDRIRERNQ